jgi:hypothetical protein
MSLDDRFRLVVAIDSVGYVQSLRRVLMAVGINLESVCPVLDEYCRRLDHEKKAKAIYRNKPTNKTKRDANTKAKVRAWVVGERRAIKTGREYGSGKAMETTAAESNLMPPKQKITARDETVEEIVDGLTIAQLADTSNSVCSVSSPEKSIASSNEDGTAAENEDQDRGCKPCNLKLV